MWVSWGNGEDIPQRGRIGQIMSGREDVITWAEHGSSELRLWSPASRSTFWLQALLVVWPWAGYLPSLCLSFLISVMRMVIIVHAPLQHYIDMCSISVLNSHPAPSDVLPPSPGILGAPQKQNQQDMCVYVCACTHTEREQRKMCYNELAHMIMEV